MRVTLYRLPSGRLTFDGVAGDEEVPAELADGYRIGEGAYDGRALVFGKPGELGMSADAAVEAGVLELLAP